MIKIPNENLLRQSCCAWAFGVFLQLTGLCLRKFPCQTNEGRVENFIMAWMCSLKCAMDCGNKGGNIPNSFWQNDYVKVVKVKFFRVDPYTPCNRVSRPFPIWPIWQMWPLLGQKNMFFCGLAKRGNQIWRVFGPPEWILEVSEGFKIFNPEFCKK